MDGKPVGWFIPEGQEADVKAIIEKNNTYVSIKSLVKKRDGLAFNIGYVLKNAIRIPEKAEKVKLFGRGRFQKVSDKNVNPYVQLFYYKDKNTNGSKRIAENGFTFHEGDGKWEKRDVELTLPADAKHITVSLNSGFNPETVDFDDIEVSFK